MISIVLLLSCFITTGSLGSPDLLLSYSIITASLHSIIILIITNQSTVPPKLSAIQVENIALLQRLKCLQLPDHFEYPLSFYPHRYRVSGLMVDIDGVRGQGQRHNNKYNNRFIIRQKTWPAPSIRVQFQVDDPISRRRLGDKKALNACGVWIKAGHQANPAPERVALQVSKPLSIVNLYVNL